MFLVPEILLKIASAYCDQTVSIKDIRFDFKSPNFDKVTQDMYVVMLLPKDILTAQYSDTYPIIFE